LSEPSNKNSLRYVTIIDVPLEIKDRLQSWLALAVSRSIQTRGIKEETV